MFNLISSEWYKLRKSKSFFVCTLIAIALVALTYGALHLAMTQQTVSTGSETSGEVVVHMEQQVSILDVLQVILCVFVPVMTCIFACIFVITEYGSGAIKNITGKGYTRRQVFQSKYLATVMASTLMTIIVVIATLLLGICFMGLDELNGAFFKNLCIYTGVQILLGIAMIGIVIAICDISRSVGIAISISLVIVTCSTIFSGALDMLFLKINFRPSEYWIMDLIEDCPMTNIDATFLTHAAIAIIFWFVASLVIGTIHFQKRDVK